MEQIVELDYDGEEEEQAHDYVDLVEEEVDDKLIDSPLIVVVLVVEVEVEVE